MSKRAKKSAYSVAHFAAEVFPFSKTGGLAHVALDLPKNLAKLGHKMVVFTPLYGRVRQKLRNRKLLIKDLSVRIDSTSTLTFSVHTDTLKVSEAGEVVFYFIDHYKFFGRYSRNYYSHQDTPKHFYFFCLAAIELIKHLDLEIDLFHCHDWMMALLPQILRFSNPFLPKQAPKTLLTIHNLAFQGSSFINNNRFTFNDKINPLNGFPNFDDDSSWQKINFLKRGIRFADEISTVSNGYASEITTRDYGEGLHKLLQQKAPIKGIINGIDHKYFDAETSKYVWHKYNSATWPKQKRLNKKTFLRNLKISPVHANLPLVIMTQRITYQKGFDLIVDSLEAICQRQLILIIIGEGIGEYVHKLRHFKPQSNSHFRYIDHIDEALELQAIASADMILLPSRYEPCGTSHMKAMRFGVVPIARKTGGLADTIFDYSDYTKTGTGFLFLEMEQTEILNSLDRAIKLHKSTDWPGLVKKVMSQTFTWDKPAWEYAQLYKTILANFKL